MKKLILTFICLFLATPCQAAVITVDANGSADHDNIQAAIDVAVDGDTVIVAPGTYYENIRMKNGVTLQGSGADITTIDGGENGHVVVFNLASGTISGFTVTNSGSNPRYAGAIFTSQCTVRIENNTIVNNNRGIILSSNSTAVVVGNRIMNNTGVFGHGIKVMSSSAAIVNNVIVGNQYSGISCDNSSPLIINNTIIDNGHYGIRCNPISTQVIANNIITDNEYGIMALGGAESPVPLLHIAYNDVWNNSEANYWYEWGIVCFPEIDCEPAGASESFEPQPGTGEISQDPLFVDKNNGDYHLLEGSPCIDAGDPNYIAEPNETDLDGNPRIIGEAIDMGAYEFNPPVEAAVKFTPQTLNCNSKGKWAKAHFVLPEGFSPEDVDVNEPAVAELMEIEIESHHINVFVDDDGFVGIEVVFDREAFCDIVTGNDSVDIEVTGSFTTGRYFSGTDTIKVIGRKDDD